MSFSLKAKQELCRIPVKRACCRVAALSSFLQMAGALQLGTLRKVRLNSESYAVARWGVTLSKKAFGTQAEVLVTEHNRLGKHQSFCVVLSGAQIDELLLQTQVLRQSPDGFVMGGGTPSYLFDRQNECCRRAFMRGAFLGGGSLNDPERGYHLELVAKTQALGEDLCKLLNVYELNAKLVMRKGNHVVYLKESDKITEFLTLIGAHSALLDVETVRVFKEFRNNLNRQVNCETANIQKTVTAAYRQSEAVTALIQAGIYETLSEPLKQTAQARLNHPDASLQELVELLGGDVSKSCINHRLRKLELLSKQLHEQQI